MKSKMNSLHENQVCDLVSPPKGIKPIDCKWVFKRKIDVNNNTQTYKANLVVKGYR